MSYRIGELAEMLNISTEMIRYYEKNGVIKPQRDEKSNYRTYTMLDVFTLTEAIQLKSLHMNIKEINKTKSNDYTHTIVNHLTTYKNQLIDQLDYYQLLIERIDHLIDRNKTTCLNKDNYWIKNIPAYNEYYMLKSKDDTYYDIETPLEIMQYFFSDTLMPFVDTIVKFDEDFNHWYYAFENKYQACLSLPLDKQITISEELCLCTIIDMGNLGNFNNDCILPLEDYAHKHGFQQIDNITGLLCSRGNDNHEYHRYMELRMPIQKL